MFSFSIIQWVHITIFTTQSDPNWLHPWYLLIDCLSHCSIIIRKDQIAVNNEADLMWSWYLLLKQLPVSHFVPLHPGAQLQLNPLIRSVQVPLFLQGWLAHASISVLRGKNKKKVMKISFNKICIDRNKSNGGQPFLLKTIFPGHSFKGVHYHWWLKVLHNLMSFMLLCRNWKPWKRVHQMCFTIIIKWMTIGKRSNWIDDVDWFSALRPHYRHEIWGSNIQKNNLKREEKYITLATVTCFTLCTIKSCGTAAVESVLSVCAGPVVHAGMTCTVVDICFKRWDWKD